MKTLKALLTGKTEEVNEVSKALLGRYIQKAAISAAEHAAKSEINKEKWTYESHSKRVHKRMSGINKAVNRLRKEDLDTLVDELSSEDLQYLIEAANK